MPLLFWLLAFEHMQDYARREKTRELGRKDCWTLTVVCRVSLMSPPIWILGCDTELSLQLP